MTDDSLRAQAEPLIDLLIAQCADLEALLALARHEAEATETRDFDEVMRIVGSRAALGERLEVYHRQIAEMRARMGEAAESVLRAETSARAAQLITRIQTQDRRTRALLLEARQETANNLRRMERAQRGTSAYLRAAKPPAVACDQTC